MGLKPLYSVDPSNLPAAQVSIWARPSLNISLYVCNLATTFFRWAEEASNESNMIETSINKSINSAWWRSVSFPTTVMIFKFKFQIKFITNLIGDSWMESNASNLWSLKLKCTAIASHWLVCNIQGFISLHLKFITPQNANFLFNDRANLATSIPIPNGKSTTVCGWWANIGNKKKWGYTRGKLMPY